MTPENRRISLNFNNIRPILRSLKYRNYRLFFSGQLISLSGMWIQQVAMSWLIYSLTDSPFMLGLVTFLSQVPVFFFSPFAGVYVDRWNKHRTLIITQSVFMLQAFILTILTLTGNIMVWHIMILCVVLGITTAFDMPVRQSFLVEMIDNRKDLGNAIALNSSLVNMTRLIGPAIAGIIVAKLGEGICFLINGVTFIAVIVALLLMKIKRSQLHTSQRNAFTEFKEGLRYSFGFPPIRDLLILLAVMSFAIMQYPVLMPIFARDILKGGSDTLGFLMAASGVGALTGGIYLASRKTILGLGRIMTVAAFTFSGAIIIFAFSKYFILSMFVLLFAGFGFILIIAISNTILQTITDDEKRGRVMSLFSMAFLGMAPFGSLLSGAIADHIGGPLTIMINGIISLICGILLIWRLPTLRKMIHPIYIRRGIIPEVAKSLQTATDLDGRTEL